MQKRKSQSQSQSQRTARRESDTQRATHQRTASNSPEAKISSPASVVAPSAAGERPLDLKQAAVMPPAAPIALWQQPQSPMLPLAYRYPLQLPQHLLLKPVAQASVTYQYLRREFIQAIPYPRDTARSRAVLPSAQQLKSWKEEAEAYAKSVLGWQAQAQMQAQQAYALQAQAHLQMQAQAQAQAQAYTSHYGQIHAQLSAAPVPLAPAPSISEVLGLTGAQTIPSASVSSQQPSSFFGSRTSVSMPTSVLNIEGSDQEEDGEEEQEYRQLRG